MIERCGLVVWFAIFEFAIKGESVGAIKSSSKYRLTASKLCPVTLELVTLVCKYWVSAWGDP